MNELVIDSNSNGIDLALLYNKQLTELHKEDSVSSFLIGDVYLAKVKNSDRNVTNQKEEELHGAQSEEKKHA